MSTRIRVGDLVQAGGVHGTVTYVRYAASATPLAVTVCTGGPFDLTHPAPADVRLAS